ncbi:hypothetical protein MYA08_001861 [Cronobacter sakazakii]|uniref:hypothetical protein n=1 Tax=Cronobacter sakazakii TaxID=28141 RepID=UPI002895CB3D|nr:hypothetical protein [Cronobacter sakazakii]ELY2854106.1 hypothetical protein [Cronobacter dublinensis]EJC1153976.1 hypothetical protein [Cronobacter sakazakii]EJC1182284.1 hypothetical protein [Cronobacter sakazakii]EJC1244286.1 hypothetical protein [Cronobacter sakazakii]EJC2073244.1 hypothetical protein [Cronobacter sakazakii]
MGITLFKLEIGDDIVSKSIDSATGAWDKIDSKHPVIGAALALSIPFILLYFIYTWGKLRAKEKDVDERVSKANRSRKQTKGGKK